ncbi:nuclear pore complex protein NUP1-like [Cornus florida]|uniref:nuclear pore complex protein NUP1-like n=1 Tax=Cornus florida TaxID=4283 RepID=UPI002898D2F1|nr:nuclear pore complex protein NUP1-like [Cornus florida]
MATTGDGRGGAGGKFGKRPLRRPQATPYDRPPTALRGHRNNWLSKLVDPASKLISASAHLFFSSVFRKRLLPPPPQPSPGANQESRDTLQVCQTGVPNNFSPKNPPGTREPIVDDSANLSNSYDSSAISALEQMLKQKTFSRSEIDRLTELLQSRTSDLPVGDENKKNEANLPKPVSASARQGEFSSCPRKENGIESHGLHGVVSAPVDCSRVPEDVASPAELAKVYMGGKPSKALPSMSVFHSQVPREDATLPNNVPFTPKSPVMSLASKSAACVALPENGFITPRSRGRSAIYCMARTPYPRVLSNDQKGVGSRNNGYGVLSSSSFQYAWEKDGRFGSKQVALKRRSYVLEDNIGSVGPIRRIRQKPNLLSPKGLSLSVSGSPLSCQMMEVGSDTAQHPTSSTQKLHLLDTHKVSNMLRENEDNGVCRTSFGLVPSKSTEMATKIFQQLDKLKSTEKSSETKLVAARNKLPTRLTPSMLSGKALKSLEDVDSSKCLQKFQNSHNLEDTLNTSLPDARDSTSQKQDKVEDVPKALVVPCDSSPPAVIGADDTFSIKNSVPCFKSADSAIANFFDQPPQKKRAFRMSAHEDSLELDDDDVSTLLADREKSETPVVENKGIVSEAAAVDRNPTLSEFNPPAGSELNKGTDLGNDDKNLAGEKSTSFTFPTAHSSSMALEPAVPTPQPTSAFGKPVPPKEPNVPPPLFSLGNKNVDKSFILPSSSSVGDSSGLKTSVLLDPKPESSNSFGNVSSGPTDSVLENVKSDKDDNKNTRHVGNIMEKSGTVFSSASSTSTPTSSIFSFGAPASNSSLNNGSLASSLTTHSSPTSDLPPSNLSIQNFTNSSMHVVASSATTATKTSTSSSTNPATAFSANIATMTSISTTNPATAFSATTATMTSIGTATPGNAFSATTAIMTSIGTATPANAFSATPATMTSIRTTTPATVSSSSVTTPATTPLFSTQSNFRFGSTVAPSTSVSAESTSGVQDDANSKAITDKNTTFGNLISSPFGGTSFAMAGTGTNIFGASASATSTANSQSQGSLFGRDSANAGGAQASAGTSATVTQTIPVQFVSSASSPVFGSTGTTFPSGNSLFSSSTLTSAGLSSAASSSENNSMSSSGGASSLFGSSWQPAKSPIFGASSSASPFNSPSSSTGFPFGSSSASVATTGSAPSMVFGSSTGASTGSTFSFTSAATNHSSLTPFSQTQPVFGNPTSVFTAASGNGDQMNMEDSMAEDTVQASTPALPIFGQPSIPPSSGFMFGSSAPSATTPFQFGGQQNQATQNASPFQASGSLDLSAGGSFSLGTGGADKSRRIVRPNKGKHRRK